MKVGNGLDDGVMVGPLIDEPTFEKVTQHVDDARHKGASVALGGHPQKNGGGYFFEPTVLLDVDEGMLVSQEETSGPVAALLTFDTEEEGLAFMKATPGQAKPIDITAPEPARPAIPQADFTKVG